MRAVSHAVSHGNDRFTPARCEPAEVCMPWPRSSLSVNARFSRRNSCWLRWGNVADRLSSMTPSSWIRTAGLWPSPSPQVQYVPRVKSLSVVGDESRWCRVTVGMTSACNHSLDASVDELSLRAYGQWWATCSVQSRALFQQSVPVAWRTIRNDVCGTITGRLGRRSPRLCSSP